MNEWPVVWILLATFKRTEAALFTIESLRTRLKYPRLHFHICDDGSGETDDGTGRDHVQVLKDAIAQFDPGVTAHVMTTPHGQFNTGGNINAGIETMKSYNDSIYMLVFDDWSLLGDLDISPAVDILDSREDVGFVRLSYWVPGMSGVCVNYPSRRLGGDFIWIRLIRQWTVANPWQVDTYMASTQPFVAHTRFHDAYGMHPEHCSPGDAETRLCQQYVESRHGENGPQILFPIGPAITHAPWGHMVGRAHFYKEQFGA